MLNELHRLVEALERRGTRFAVLMQLLPSWERQTHSTSFSQSAIPMAARIISGADASRLMRVAHTSAGSAFPGFNLPIPLRVLPRPMEGEALRFY